MITFETFVRTSTGKKIANPNVNTYAGQCVSLCQAYLYECAGIKYAARGNAKDYAANLVKLGLATKVSKPKKGDIISFPTGYYGADKNYGHVAIYYDEYHLFQQNVNGDMTASLDHGYHPPISGSCTIARPKNVVIGDAKSEYDNSGQVEALYDNIRVRTAPTLDPSSDTGKRYQTGMTLNYQSTVFSDGWLWASYVSYSGERHYVALCKDDGTSKYWKQL